MAHLVIRVVGMLIAALCNLDPIHISVNSYEALNCAKLIAVMYYLFNISATYLSRHLVKQRFSGPVQLLLTYLHLLGYY